jgi:hypothetical protein
MKNNDNDFKALEKENKKLRDKIDDILTEYLSTIDDNYSIIWEQINFLIENELEQEKLCGR